MKIDYQMIDRISRLACLAFGEEEKGTIRRKLAQILTFVEKIKALDTEYVEPLVSGHLFRVSKVLRKS